MESQTNAYNRLAERIRILYGQLPTIVGGSVVVSIALTWVILIYSPSDTIIFWMFVFLVFSLLRFLHYLRSRTMLSPKTEIKPDDLKKLCFMAVLSAGTAGCIWGSVPWLFFDASQPILVIFLVIINVGMLASSVSAWSSYMITYIAFAIPNTLPLVILLSLQGDPAFAVIAVLLAASLLANIGYGFRYQKSMRQSISLRFENIDLINRLQLEIDRAEQASHDKTMFI
ncbi:MAG: hypothetical protein KAI73_08925, partial [Rhodospirillaceae bacterium]|nr:hypothetical protein [Rhodospirillaceae bacterium]